MSPRPIHPQKGDVPLLWPPAGHPPLPPSGVLPDLAAPSHWACATRVMHSLILAHTKDLDRCTHAEHLDVYGHVEHLDEYVHEHLMLCRHVPSMHACMQDALCYVDVHSVSASGCSLVDRFRFKLCSSYKLLIQIV
jgi:hypothetical protein